MRKLLLPLLSVAAVAFLFSCQRKHYDISENDGGFMPLEIGKYIVYNVDSTIYNDFNKLTTYPQSQERYEVVDTFRDDQGRLSYRINVMWRKQDGDPYIMERVIYATRTSTGVEYTDRNVKTLKLVFPVTEGKSWDGNVFLVDNVIDDEEDLYQYDRTKYSWNYVYSSLGADFNPGNNLYEQTVHVDAIDVTTNNPDADSTVYADRNFYREVYASGVGLVYRERIFWIFQPSVTPEGQPTAGSGYRKGYGVTLRAIDNN